MVPSAFVVLDAYPLNPNGKLDRKALPVPDQSAVVAREYEAPQDAIESALAAVWQELLGLDRIGRHDHFFELGGHSLMVISLIEKLRLRGLEGRRARRLHGADPGCDGGPDARSRCGGDGGAKPT
ncbi:phosphopantetheine-binding protein [Massilia sp. B-10]|nr:phosphopantetheine-binding protein [Massilia sp. B-10]